MPMRYWTSGLMPCVVWGTTFSFKVALTSMKRIRFASFLGGVCSWHCCVLNEVHCNISRHIRMCIIAETVDQSLCTCVCHISSIVIIIYHHLGYSHRVIDNMPVTWCYTVANSAQPFCTTRFPVGCYVTHSGKPHDACFLSVSCCHDNHWYDKLHCRHN